MNAINNNQFEVKPNSKSKRKITTPCPNAYLNPALDLLVNEDPMCNTAMEIQPIKKRKRTKSCDITTFENTGLDLGISKAAVNEFLVRELENVRKNMKSYNDCTRNTENSDIIEDNVANNVTDSEISSIAHTSEPIYANVTDMSIIKAICPEESIAEENLPNMAVVGYQPNMNNEISSQTMEQSLPTIDINPPMELSSFHPDISEIEMDSGISVLESKSLTTTTSVHNGLENDTDISMNATNVQQTVRNQIIINNTSNINLSFIDRLALDSPNLSNQSLYLDDDLNESNIMEVKTITIITKKKRIINKKKNTNPFLEPNINEPCQETSQNPFLVQDVTKPELEYNDEAMMRPIEVAVPQGSNLMPRRLFSGDNNSTISTVNESINTDQHEYENIDSYRAESPIYENVSGEFNETIYNKQSKILGHDVSRFSAVDIMNLNKHSEANCSNESSDSKKDFKHQILKAGNKLSKKVFKTIKKTFKTEKVEHNTTLNPYEVPRKPPKQKPVVPKESGIENPALNLDNSDEIEIEEIDDDEEHQYETIKTLRNTRLNMNVTPLRERVNENADCSQNRPNTPGKKVRFDSTLNQEKVITGNSFDYGIQSPGFDAKIDKYHDELENCINERKFLQQNM